MRVINTLNDAITETKTKRELTGESTAVIHLHRKCVTRRDSLLFFNQKSFNMRVTNDEGNSPRKLATTANEIINNFAENSAKVRLDREFLKQMCAASLKGDDEDFRKEIFFLLYEDFDRLLESIEVFKLAYIGN